MLVTSPRDSEAGGMPSSLLKIGRAKLPLSREHRENKARQEPRPPDTAVFQRAARPCVYAARIGTVQSSAVSRSISGSGTSASMMPGTFRKCRSSYSESNSGAGGQVRCLGRDSLALWCYNICRQDFTQRRVFCRPHRTSQRWNSAESVSLCPLWTNRHSVRVLQCPACSFPLWRVR